MSMGKKFIKVSDVETANLLTKLGFQLIDKTSGIYRFLNNTTTKFSNDIDKSKVQYSNVLFI